MSPSGLDEAIRRRRLLYLTGIGAFLALEAVLVIVAFAMRAHEQVLDRGAVRTEAVVKDSRHYRLRPEGAAVRYQVDGREIETILTVDDSVDFGKGERVVVEYDPRNPSHARPVEGWEPTYEYLLFLGAFAAVALPVVTGRQAWRDLQAARATQAQPETSTMHARVYRSWSWVLPFPDVHFLVGLWSHHDPSASSPPVSLEVAEDDAYLIPSGVVTAHGRVQPGCRVILEAGGKFFWPRRKVRRGLPDTARALG